MESAITYSTINEDSEIIMPISFELGTDSNKRPVTGAGIPKRTRSGRRRATIRPSRDYIPPLGDLSDETTIPPLNDFTDETTMGIDESFFLRLQWIEIHVLFFSTGSLPKMRKDSRISDDYVRF